MKFYNLLILISVFFIGGISCAKGQYKQGMFNINGQALPYLVSFPEDYDLSKKYPLLIFLHGAGERGEDGKKQTAIGGDFLLKATGKEYPAIVLLPQCPSYSFWSNVKYNQVENQVKFSFGHGDDPTMAMKALIPFIDDWVNSGNVDESRVYVGGVSMGGLGTFELLWRMPGVFAGAFIICGGGDAAKIDVLAKHNVPIWLFHGDKDEIIDVNFSRDIYKKMKEDLNVQNVRYKEYKDANHEIWDLALKEPDLMSWLFSFQKNK